MNLGLKRQHVFSCIPVETSDFFHETSLFQKATALISLCSWIGRWSWVTAAELKAKEVVPADLQSHKQSNINNKSLLLNVTEIFWLVFIQQKLMCLFRYVLHFIYSSLFIWNSLPSSWTKKLLYFTLKINLHISYTSFF